MRIVPLLIVLMLLAPSFGGGATRASADEFEIGDFPVTIELEGKWRRKRWTAGSEDQFQTRGLKRLRLFVLQRVEPVGGKAAIQVLFDSMMEDLREGFGFSPSGPQVVYDEEGGSYAIARSVSYSKEALINRYAITTKGGLTHVLVGSSAVVHEKQLIDLIDTLAREFPQPDADSTWAEVGAMKRFTAERAWGSVALSYRPAVWNVMENDDAILELEAIEVETIYLFEGEESDLDAVCDARADYFRESGFDPSSPRDRSHGSLEGREVQAVSEDGNQIRALYLPLGGNGHLEVRLVLEASDPVVKEAWESVLDSLAVTVKPPVLAFPEPVPPARSHSPPEPPPSMAPWLAEAKWLGTAPGIDLRGAIASEGGYLVYGQGGVQRITAERNAEWVYGTDSTITGCWFAVEDGEPFFTFGGRMYHYDSTEASWTEQEPRQSLRAHLEGGTYRVATFGDANRHGFSGLPAPQADQLEWVVGEERTVARSLVGRTAYWLVADRSKSFALYGDTPLQLDDSRARWDREELSLLEPGGKITPIAGTWNLLAVGRGDRELLLTGTPTGGIAGIYRFTPGSEPELLLSGVQFRGVEIDAETVVLAGPPFEPALEATRGAALYRVSLETLRAHGPRTMPFGFLQLSAIGAEALAATDGGTAGAFATAASIEAFTERCSEIAKRRFGRELPSTAKEIDRGFLTWIHEAKECDPVSRAVLTAIVTDELIAQGARWVETGTGRKNVLAAGVPVAEPTYRATSFAFARNPGRIVWDTLFDDDSYYRPVEEVGEAAEGRQILLSFDPDALAEALLEFADTPAYDALGQSDTVALEELLAEHRENEYLRYEVYDHLMARERYADIRRVAVPYLAGDEPEFMDLRADLAARVAIAKASTGVTDVEPLVEDLFRILRRFPRSMVAYELLAQTYLLRDGDEDRRRARACLDKALSLNDSGEIADRVRAQLEQLDASSR